MIRVLLLLLFIGVYAQARELKEYMVNPRAMGMGNAYSSVVDDKNALFYNPAALSKITGVNWTIIDPSLGADGYDVYNTLKNASSSYVTTVNALYGKRIWVNENMKTAISFSNFAGALFEEVNLGANLHNPAFPVMNVNAFADYGIATGVSIDMGSVASIGIVGKRISRIGSDVPVGVDTMAAASSSAVQSNLDRRGTGYGLDAGLLFTIPAPVKPTLSAVWKDIGQTNFIKDASSTLAPPPNTGELLVGFSLDIDLTVLHIRPSVDYKHMDLSDEQLGKKIHMGVEFDFPIIAARAGFNQGYYTLGAGVDLGLLKVDAATYGVELGEYPGQHEDRRYVVQATFELGVDLGFGNSSGSSSGSKKKLKQRR